MKRDTLARARPHAVVVVVVVALFLMVGMIVFVLARRCGWIWLLFFVIKIVKMTFDEKNMAIG